MCYVVLDFERSHPSPRHNHPPKSATSADELHVTTQHVAGLISARLIDEPLYRDARVVDDRVPPG
jgi:hypothetical protein